MATVGQALTSPESGWKRVEIDVNPPVTALNDISGWNESGLSGGYISSISSYNSIKFTFTGTRIRLITKPFNNRFNNNIIVIDGVSETFSDYRTSSISQCLTYEKVGLEDKEHTCVIIAGDAPSSSTLLTLDAIDIDANATIYPSPFTVGDIMKIPEKGWKRYDDTNSAILRIASSWTQTNLATDYKGSLLYTSDPNAKITFKFEGTKIRLVSAYSISSNVDSVDVLIDGQLTENITLTNNNETRQVVVYEKIGLDKGIHTVEILNKSQSGNFGIDAVDIDESGRLIHPDEVFDVNDLDVGKRIRCHYKASSNSVGVFSGIGQETSDFIPVTSSATPNGDFYFIMVEDWNGNKRLIADRNIQHSISWDTLNASGLVSKITMPKVVFGDDGGDLKVVSNLGLRIRDIYNTSTGQYVATRVTNGVTSGKWYWEMEPLSYSSSQTGVRTFVGVLDKESVISNSKNGSNVDEFLASVNKCHLFANNTKNLVVGVALDVDNNEISFYTDGVFSKKETLENGIEWFPFYASKWNTDSIFNFGTSPFRYSPPEGFLPYNDSVGADFIPTIRLMTGGVSSSDKDNEWDKYIVNSTLNGTITAGDKDTWNWETVYSWTSTTPSGSTSNRVLRGGNAASGYASGVASSNSANTRGFRPVLEIVFKPSYKSFIFHNGSYKKYDGQWSTVSTTLPSVNTFKNEGINDLSVFDRKTVTITIPMDDNTTSGEVLGSGRVFKEKVDLKKLIQISSIKVK